MIETQFILKEFSLENITNGSTTWKTPSNIALVKYWGKQEPQIPENASISFTLNNCFTLTTLEYKRHSELVSGSHNEMLKQVQHDEIKEAERSLNREAERNLNREAERSLNREAERSLNREAERSLNREAERSLNREAERSRSFEIYFEGEKKDDFKPKIATFFKRIEQYVPFLKDFEFVIKSENSFPHSSGIASSASGMGALALCVMSLEKILNPKMSIEYFNKKASFLARLGSGSACRSIEGPLIVWGNHPEIEGSSDLFGVKFPYKIHDNFKNYQDTILLVDEGEKQVSSTVGHQLMYNHPFADQRFQQANDNISKISKVLQNGDLSAFIAIVESEALSLHAMMMTSNPYFILMKPNTLKIINEIWDFRAKTNANICFTLDAGANVHVLFPEKEKETVNNFIKSNLIHFCQENHYICDVIGDGATSIFNL